MALTVEGAAEGFFLAGNRRDGRRARRNLLSGRNVGSQLHRLSGEVLGASFYGIDKGVPLGCRADGREGRHGHGVEGIAHLSTAVGNITAPLVDTTSGLSTYPVYSVFLVYSFLHAASE